MHRLFSVPLAKLLELYFALNFFLVFSAPIVNTLAGLALELNEKIL